MQRLSTRRPALRSGRLLALAATGLLALTGGTGAVLAADPSPSAPNVLKVATTAGITTWDPVKSFSTEAFYLANIYEPLLWVNPPGADKPFTPALATSWEHSADGLTWTFHLRDGVTFHDGTPMDAAAVVKSIEAAKDHGGASFIWAPLDTITAVDASTVEMKLTYAAPMDLVASSLYGAWIVSPAALDAAAKDDKYFESGVDGGTGPYTIGSYTPDSEVLLKAYAGYWGGWSDVKHYDNVLATIIRRGGRPAAGARRRRRGHGLHGAPDEHRLVQDQPRLHGRPGALVLQLRGPLQHRQGAARRSQGPPGAVVRHPLRRHHHGRHARLWHAVARPRAGRRVPLRRHRAAVHLRPRQGQGAAQGGRPRGWRLQHGDHLRGREPGRDAVRAAHPGLLQQAGHRRDAHADDLRPAVGTSQGRRRRRARTCSCCSTGRPTRTPARTTCTRCSTAARIRTST